MPVPRPPRICIPRLPHHVVHRGNNRCPIFNFTEDFLEYLAALQISAEKSDTAIHAYALMSNHVHLLVTPSDEHGLSRLVHGIGIRYVPYFNRRYGRSGTLWEGRFRCSVVESERYCLECYRYIDLNPVRASIVNSPIDYIWSSCRSNALGERNDLLVPHDLYTALGKDLPSRTQVYRELLDSAPSKSILKLFRDSTSGGLPVGSADFVEKVVKTNYPSYG